jgi:predicted AAA+ superfamily ATPase
MFLKDLNYFGFLFENLVMRDLKTFGSIKRFKVLQYRDSNGLECDAILEKDDGTWGCIEIKLGNDEVEKAIRTFEIFDNKVGSKSKIKPSFYAVITGVGGILEKRKNVFIIPFDTLGI